MPITPLYAAIFGLIFIALSVRVIGLRRQLRVGLGDGGKPILAHAIGVHSNFAEYTPLALLIIVLLESRTGSGWWIHALCLVLLVGRLVHAYGVSQVKENYDYRVAGMMMTFATLVAACLGIVWVYLMQL